MSVNVTLLCGDEGLDVWNPLRRDLGLCFQQLFLDVPLLALLAVASSYYLGRGDGFVSRGSPQLLAIRIRCFVTLLLAGLPLVQIYVYRFKAAENVPQVAYFLSSVQGLAYFVHFLYNMSLRTKFGLSPRGPTLIRVLWCSLFVMTVIAVRSHLLLLKHSERKTYSQYLAYGMSLCYLIVQLFYGLSLLPGEGQSVLLHFYQSYTEIGDGETQALLSANAYQRFSEEGDPLYLGVALENVTWLSKLFFSWVAPLMRKGAGAQLKTSDDLYDLPVSLNCSTITAELDRALYERRSQELQPIAADLPQRSEKFILFKALHKVFRLEFYSVGVLKLLADLAGFGGPMLLNQLINFIETKDERTGWGYVYALGLICTALTGALCDCHFNFLIAKVTFRMRGAIVATIYRKTLSVNAAELAASFSVGEIVNFMSTDCDRIVNSCPSFHALWSIPFQLAVTLYLLYSQVGLAFLAGLIFSIVLIPINKLIANKIARLSTHLMRHKDHRVKIIAETLRGIKCVKLHAWENYFQGQIQKSRRLELKYLKGRKYLDALCVYFWATTPVVVCILTFATYSLMGNQLNAATVFTSMALLNMLIAPLNAFPWVLNGLTEAWVSLKRIEKLLCLKDSDWTKYYEPLEGDYDVVLQGAGFNYANVLTEEERARLHAQSRRWKGKGRGKGRAKDDSGRFALQGIDLKVRKGEFIGVMGPVGSGKSSLLSAILGELSLNSGSISISQIDSGFGYVTQRPWLQRGTVRDNITFGRPYDETRYRSVLFACALLDDMASLNDGDLTAVGEGGATLSGGQRARVALARAVYQDKAVYLLDDILSAVDHNVAKHIFQRCILGLLRDKTRILCTHHVRFLAYSDRILVMEAGSVKRQGPPSEVLRDIDDEGCIIDLELGDSLQSNTESLLESVGTNKDSNIAADAEQSETGSVKFSVLSSYWRNVGHLLCSSILLSIVAMQVSRNVTDWWLAEWVGSGEAGTNVTGAATPFLKVYVELAVVNSVFTLLRAFLFAYGGVAAARQFHKLLLRSVLRGKARFFDVTPLGRILNRFSSDTYTIDDSLPFILNIFLAQFFALIGSLGITVYGLPWICMFLVPLVPVYDWLQRHYRATSRDLKRISSATLSPVYSHFGETLQGLTTINAMRVNQRFKRENQLHVDANIKAQFSSQIVNRWLGLRLQLIGVAIVSGVSLIAVVQHQYDVANASFVGLAVSYALSVTSLLSGVVNAFTETEREMIAVERVNQYVNEIPLETSRCVAEPPFGWPAQGVVAFKRVTLAYRDHLAPSLKSVNFETRPGEKVGVVGRTGAGKSSLIAALFRLTEISSGEISIDSVNVKNVSLATLRSRMFCIPQEPFLFSGSLRDNLDPLGEFRDEEIWSALCKVNLEATLRHLGGLERTVDGDGANFSVGQQQLICLARAVLHNCKILCIDEATANVDQETDRQIQLTLRSAFRKSTVITIAHRAATIMDSDRVLVLRDGEAVEFDSPDRLLSDSGSHFYRLVNQE